MKNILTFLFTRSLRMSLRLPITLICLILCSTTALADYTALFGGTSQASSVTSPVTIGTTSVSFASSVSFSSGTYQLGSATNNTNQNYFEVNAGSSKISKVAFLMSGNGSNKRLKPALLGWETEIEGTTSADYYDCTKDITISSNSYASAQWFEYDVSAEDLSIVRIYKGTKDGKITVGDEVVPNYSDQTIRIWGVKVELKATTSAVECGAAATLIPAALGAYTVDQWSTPSPLTFSATAVNGGELSYQWYQWVDGDAEHGTEATKIKAVGTDATTNSFTPDVTTASVRHYICIVKEAGCTNEARLNVGTYTVNEADIPDGSCAYEWGVGTSQTTAPANGNSVTIYNDFIVSNSGASATTATVYSGSGSQNVLQSGGSGKNILGSLNGKNIASLEVGITTTSSGKTRFFVAFASTPTFSADKIINFTSVTDQLFAGDAIENGANKSIVSINAPDGAKSFAIARNFSDFATTATTQNNGNRNIWYLKVCSAEKYSVTYDANGATGTVPTENTKYYPGDEATVLGNTGNLEKTGLVFAGWNTKADGTGDSYAAGDKLTMGDEDVTLYAQWGAPCDGPVITAQNLPGNAGLKMFDDPVEMSVTASPQNGGTLSYKWYQNTEGSKLGANVMEAEGTNNLATYHPTTDYAHTHFYWCVVTESGCSTTTESNLSGIITVAKGRAKGWVIFDGTFDTSFNTGEVTYSGATVSYEITTEATMIDVSAYTNNANSRDYEKAIKVSKTNGATDINRSLKFTVPEGYKLVKVSIAGSGSGNRTICLASSLVTSADAADVIETLLSVSANKITARDYVCDLPSGDYYLCGGFEGDWYIADLQLVLEALPCTAPTINSFTGHDGIVDYGNSFTLSVNATANDANELKYEWWYYMGNTTTEYHKIATTTTNSITIANDGTYAPTTDVGMYFFYCVVKSLSCSAQTAVSGANTFNALVCAAPTSVVISGSYWYLGGQTLSLTATPSGHTGTPKYQWQKETSTDVWENIAGATSATYSKTNCGYGDSGSYRCVVTTGEGCSKTSDLYGVHVFSLNGGYDSEAWTANDIVFTAGTSGTATVHLQAGKLYKFKVNSNYGHWYGNGGSDPAWDGWYTLYGFSNWNFGTDGGNMRLFTGPEGDYTFTIDVEHAFDTGGQYVTVSVEYPDVEHPDAGYVYYSNPNGWTEVKAHWWKDGDGNFVDWNDSPAMSSTTICGATYWYMPKMSGYDRVIFRNSDASAQSSDIIVAAENGGQYYGADSWNDFTSYSVTYDGNDETSGTMTAEDVMCGKSLTLTANAFAKDGFTFSGWSANVAVTIGGASVSAGTLIDDGATLQNITGDITLTAQWQKICATVDIVSGTFEEGTNNALVATGTIGGSGQYYLATGKKMDKGRYTFLKLANGELKSGDVIKIDLAQLSDTQDNEAVVQLFTGDKDSHTFYATVSTPGTGVTAYTLPSDFPTGITGIGLYRSTDAEGNTYNANPYVNGITISRPNCDDKTAPSVTLSDGGTVPCPGTDVTITATSAAEADITSYEWYTADNTKLTGSAKALVVAPTEATTYYCVAYTDLYRVKSGNITITPVNVNFTSANTVQLGSPITLTGSKSGTWAITAGSQYATLSATAGETVTLTGVALGDVTVQFSADGCSYSKTITVTCATVDILVATAAKGTTSGVADGSIGGTYQGKLQSSSTKISSKGCYYFVKLANGELKSGDVITFNLSVVATAVNDDDTYAGKLVLFTGDKDNHAYYTTFEANTVGDNSYTLPSDFPSGINGIGLYRDDTYFQNPTLVSVTISRPNCENKTAPTATISTTDAYENIKEGSTVTFTATVSDPSITSGKWYKDNVVIAGETDLTLTITATEESAKYHFEAYTDLFAAKSNEITVTVKLHDFCETFEGASGYSHVAEDFTLYAVNGSGIIQTGATLCSNASINGTSTQVINSNNSCFIIKLNKPISKILLYGWNTNPRSISKVQLSETAEQASYTDITSALTLNSVKEGSYQTLTITAANHGVLPKDKYLWITFSGSAAIYRICVLYKEPEEFIFEADGNWNTAASWNFGVVPSEVDNATINAAATINTPDVEINNLTIGTGSLEVATTGLVTAHGTLTNTTHNKLIVNVPGGIAAATRDNVAARVNFHSVAKVVDGNYRWQYIGWPFTALADVHWPFSGSWLMSHNPASEQQWDYLRNGDGLTPFQGYALTQAAEKDFTWDGILNSNEGVTKDLTYVGSDNDNWNLVANSWLAPIDVATFTNTNFTNANASIYVFNTGSFSEWENDGQAAASDLVDVAGQYSTINALLASTTGYVLPPVQAFFVEATGAGAKIELNYEANVLGTANSHSSTGSLRTPRRNTAQASGVNELTHITITVRGERYGDVLHIFEGEQFTTGYDNGSDGKKVLGAMTSPQLFAQTSFGDMAILATPDIEGTTLGFRAGTADQNYTLTFGNNDGTLYITDLQNNIETEVTAGGSYSFYADNTDDIVSRFRLSRVKAAAPSNPTGLDDLQQTTYYTIDHGILFVKANANDTIRLYDATGRLIFNKSNESEVNIELPQQGVYLLRVNNTTHKIVK